MNGMKLIGEVSRDLHHCASWVRVQVMQIDGIPLSLKVHKGEFDRKLFEKGRIVEVTQSCTHNTYRYSITRVLGDYGPAEWPEIDEDRVSFYVGSRYYNSTEQQQKLKPVLMEALDMTAMEANSYMRDYGFWVVCRASQFAKFMVYRDRAGICNGFIDLRVQIEGLSRKTNQINVSDRG